MTYVVYIGKPGSNGDEPTFVEVGYVAQFMARKNAEAEYIARIERNLKVISKAEEPETKHKSYQQEQRELPKFLKQRRRR